MILLQVANPPNAQEVLHEVEKNLEKIFGEPGT